MHVETIFDTELRLPHSRRHEMLYKITSNAVSTLILHSNLGLTSLIKSQEGLDFYSKFPRSWRALI